MEKINLENDNNTKDKIPLESKLHKLITKKEVSTVEEFKEMRLTDKSFIIKKGTYDIEANYSSETSYYFNGLVTIEPGVRIIFQNPHYVIFKGGIIAKGTKTEPILFNNFHRLQVIDSKYNNKFQYCEINNSNVGIEFNKSEGSIEDCVIEHAAMGIELQDSKVKISNNKIGFNKQGIAIKDSNFEINNNSIYNNKYGIILFQKGPTFGLRIKNKFKNNDRGIKQYK